MEVRNIIFKPYGYIQEIGVDIKNARVKIYVLLCNILCCFICKL